MVKQLKLNIQSDEKMVNKKIEEEFTLTNATIYGMILCFIHGLGFFHIPCHFKTPITKNF